MVTSTPLQALVTLNDPVYAEASLALARRMQRRGGDPRGQLAWAWESVTSERASLPTLDRLERLHRAAGERYSAEPGLASEAGADPKTAALSLLANTLLNLDEALTK